MTPETMQAELLYVGWEVLFKIQLLGALFAPAALFIGLWLVLMGLAAVEAALRQGAKGAIKWWRRREPT